MTKLVQVLRKNSIFVFVLYLLVTNLTLFFYFFSLRALNSLLVSTSNTTYLGTVRENGRACCKDLLIPCGNLTVKIKEYPCQYKCLLVQEVIIFTLINSYRYYNNHSQVHICIIKNNLG